MKHTRLRNGIGAGMFLTLGLLTGCSSGYSVVSVEGGRVPMTEVYDNHIADQEAMAIINRYKQGLDSIMSPVIGHAARNLNSYRPESPLSNLMADLLRQTAVKVIGRPADVAVMNIGGIRNSFTKGEITFGNIFEISPFENTYCVLTMQGSTLQELFEQIAAVHGEGLSGAKLVITKDGKLVSATVGNKPIDPDKEYMVATIDYLAEGNDKMPAFRKAKSKIIPDDMLLRSLLFEYVEDCNKKGVFVDAKEEGRIVVR